MSKNIQVHSVQKDPMRYPLICLGGFLGVLIFAFCVREWLYLHNGYRSMAGDEIWYMRLARRFLANGITDVYFWLPGWPLFISLFLKHGALIAARHTTIFIASLNCGLVFLIGVFLWDIKTGVAAGLIMSLLPEHMFFSHYLYAEIGLETFICTFALLIAMGIRFPEEFRYMRAAFFFLGCGMLYKHFVIIPFAAMMFTLLLQRRFKDIPPLAALFFTPLFLFSIFLGLNGKDPLFWVNSPIKNAQEWGVRHPITHFSIEDRPGVLKSLAGKYSRLNAAEFKRHSWDNFRSLWGQNIYVMGRIRGYRFINDKNRARIIVAIAYSLLVTLGFLGFWLAPRTPFESFSVSTLLFLGILSSALFLVSRHRVPFLFFFALYAAYGVCRVRHVHLFLQSFFRQFFFRWRDNLWFKTTKT